MVKIILSILAITLFMGNYYICSIIYPDDIEKWWNLKQIMYNIIIMLWCYIAFVKEPGLLKSILVFSASMCVSNCIDRIFFNVNYFTFSDYLLLLISLFLFIKELNQIKIMKNQQK